MFTWTDDEREQIRREICNVYEVDGKQFFGLEEVYRFLSENGYDGLSREVIAKLLTRNFFSVNNREKYPELDPCNPDKCWKLIRRGAKSKADTSGYKVEKKFGLIYYLIDSHFNRFYGYTIRSIDREISKLREVIDVGGLSSRNPDTYEIHVYDLVEFEGNVDKAAREKIKELIRDFKEKNPDLEVSDVSDLMTRYSAHHQIEAVYQKEAVSAA